MIIRILLWPFRLFFLAFLVLAVAGGVFSSAAVAAETFRVSVLMPVGTGMMQFTLTSQDSREFLERWSALPRIDAMVPIDEGSGYRGVKLRGSRGQEYRIYNGIIRKGHISRRDDLRMLERWVLQHGPADSMASLIKDLDREVASSRGDLAFPLVHNRSAKAIIERCREEGRLNAVAKVNCLHRALSEQMAPSQYADALEKLLVDPPYMATGHVRSGPDGDDRELRAD